MIKPYLNTADLLDLTGYTRAGDVERCLTKQGIRYFWGKDGPWTTLELIAAAGGLGKQGEAQYQGAIL